MANALYDKLVSTMSQYLDPNKAALSVKRQVERTSATPDTVSAGDLGDMTSLIGAAALYVADKSQQQELIAKLKALA